MQLGQNPPAEPIIRERRDHCISRADIDADALKVLYRLSDAGYVAYLVGGSVRDLLLGRKPKDFDVGTDAHPSEIRRIFRNCFLIGRRFRLAHIVFGKKVIETSTFRRPPGEKDAEDSLYQIEDNTFGTPEEDATRRDFTINGLFYDIRTFAVIDYVGGLQDLERRMLRCIGDPNVRFREDPVRMMRAARFAARLDFAIDHASSKAILSYHADILNASRPRVCEEVFRLFAYSSSNAAFQLMWRFKLLGDILPCLSAFIDASGGMDAPTWKYLSALDRDPISATASSGLRTVCLYYAMFAEHLAAETQTPKQRNAHSLAIAQRVMGEITDRLHIPRAAFALALSLLDVQRRFMIPPRKETRAFRFIHHEMFGEALALRRIVLTAEGGDMSIVNQWQAHHNKEKNGGGEEIDLQIPSPMPDDRRRYRHRRRRRRSDDDRNSPGHNPAQENNAKE